MTALLLAPLVLALVVFLAIDHVARKPPSRVDEKCARIDRELNREALRRPGGGWGN